MVEISGAVIGLWVTWGWGGGDSVCASSYLNCTAMTVFACQAGPVACNSLGPDSSSVRKRKRK